MGKRYGRNQKRKHRERIESLEFECQSLENRYSNLKKSKDFTVESAKRIVEAVYKISPNSVFFEKAKIHENDYWTSDSNAFVDFIDFNSQADILLDIRKIRLYDLKLLMKEDRIKNMIHFSLDLHHPESKPHKAWYTKELSKYKLSEEAFSNQEVEHIVRELVGHLKKDVKENGY